MVLRIAVLWDGLVHDLTSDRVLLVWCLGGIWSVCWGVLRCVGVCWDVGVAVAVEGRTTKQGGAQRRQLGASAPRTCIILLCLSLISAITLILCCFGSAACCVQAVHVKAQERLIPHPRAQPAPGLLLPYLPQPRRLSPCSLPKCAAFSLHACAWRELSACCRLKHGSRETEL